MKRIIALITLLALSLQLCVLAVGVTVELDVSKAKKGESVTLTGTAAPDSWISIKAVDEDGNILYFNAVMSEDTGSYTDTVVVPEMNAGNLNFTAGSGSAVASAVLEVYASSGSSGSSGGSSGSSDDPEKGTGTTENKKNGDGSVTIKSEIKVDDNGGQAKTTLSEEGLEEAFKEAKSDETGRTKVVLEMEIPQGVQAFDVTFPAGALTDNLKKQLVISTDLGTVGMTGDMIGVRDGSMALSFESLNKEDMVSFAKVDEAMKATIGDRPVIELGLFEDGQVVHWENHEAPVEIAIPYTLALGEDPEHVVVYYIDGNGEANEVSNGRYNPETGMVEFDVYHFSTYAIGYEVTTFSDLTNYEWARHQIEVLASKGIINGTGDNSYTPSANIRRADFILLLVNTLDLYAEVENNFDDVMAEDYYYQAVGIAKALGITSGIGGNMFAPKEAITREDMIVLTYNALLKKELISPASQTVIQDFEDQSDIAGYAQESLAATVAEGLITGSDSKIYPKDNTTRAETAVFLYRIYNLK